MNLDHHLANTSRYAPTSLRARLAMALAAVVCSSVVLGTALGLFELQARAGIAAQVGNSPALARGTFIVDVVNNGDSPEHADDRRSPFGTASPDAAAVL